MRVVDAMGGDAPREIVKGRPGAGNSFKMMKLYWSVMKKRYNQN